MGHCIYDAVAVPLETSVAHVDRIVGEEQVAVVRTL